MKFYLLPILVAREALASELEFPLKIKRNDIKKII